MDGGNLKDTNQQEVVKALRSPKKSDKVLRGKLGCSSICQLPDVVCSLCPSHTPQQQLGKIVSLPVIITINSIPLRSAMLQGCTLELWAACIIMITGVPVDG